MKAKMAGRFMAAATAFVVAGLGLMVPGLLQAADYTWDGANDTWASAHWLPGNVAGPTASGDTAAISGGTVSFAQHDTFGNANTTSSPVITIGTGATLASGGWFTTVWGLNLAGGTLLANGGANPSYPAFQLAGSLNVTGTRASEINVGGGVNNSVNVGGSGNTALTLDVADVTHDANADLTVNTALQNSPHGAGSLIKTGAGTLLLSAVNTYTGSTIVNGGALNIATSGALLGTGLVNPVSGGVLTIAGTVTVADNGAFAVGNGTAGLGTVNIETGAVVSIGGGSGGFVGRTYIGGKLDGSGVLGTGTLNINGGALNVAAGGSGVAGDASRFWLNAWGGSGSTLNLNGGTLSTARPIANGSDTPAFFNFNGGTLQAAAEGVNILDGVGPLTVTLQSGGATIDNNGFNAAVIPAMGGAGGLTKLGSGTLALNGASTFSGNLVISGGTVSDTLAENTGTPAATSLGDMTAVGRQVQVNSGAALQFSCNDPIGSATVMQNASFIVDGGTVDHGSYFVTLPDITLRNGATLTGGNGVVGNYQTFNLMGSVTVSGTAGSTIATAGSDLTGVHLGSGNVSFIVNPTGPGPDLTVSAPLMNRPGSLAESGFTKTGAGTMVLAAANTYSGTATVNEGIVVAQSAAALPGYKVSLAAGAGLSVGVGNWSDGEIAALIGTGVYGAGTLFGFDTTAGNYVYDGRQFSVPAAAGLVKTGPKQLTISGDNTYAGNTFLRAGTTVIDGGTVSNAAYFDVGAVNSPASFIFSSGSVTAGSQFVIGAHGTSSGVQSSGTLQVNGWFYVGGYGEGTGVGTYTQLGGSVTATSGMHFNGGGPNSGVYDLAGGTLALSHLERGLTGSGTGTFNFNGGLLKPLASSGSFMQGLTAANVQLGGALFDTVGFDVTVGQPLLHDAALGASSDGGLTKLGAGTLTLAGASTYNGTTTISSGALRLGVANAIGTSSAVHVAGGVYDLGGFTVANGAVTLSSGSIINGTLNASSFALTGSGSVQANLAGGGLAKSGAGTAVLYGDNAGLGETSVTQGTLTLSKLGFADCRLRLDASDITTLAANADGTGAVTASGQPVGYWGDLSGNHKPASQAAAGRRPTYVTGVSEFNGLPVLQFDGADDDITSLLDINAANIPNLTVVMVCRQVTYKSNGGLWGHDDGLWDRLQLLNFQGIVGDNNIAGNNNSITVKGMDTNAVLIYTASLKNGVANGSYVYVNGVSDGASGLPAFTSQENTTGNASFTLANISAGNGYRGNIQIGEVLVYDTALSDVTRRNVEAYLRNKWLGASDPIAPSLPPNGAVQVATGAVLNLDGGSHTVDSVSGGGTVINGTLAVTGTVAPGGANVIGTLSLACAATLNGATLLADVAVDGSHDQLAVSGDLSLNGLTLQVAELGLLNTRQSYTLVTCTGTLTGSLAATNLPENWILQYNRTPGAGSVRLVWAPRGTMIRVL